MGSRLILSPADIRALKGRRRLAMLTAYDYPMALALDQVGLDIMLVGDSMGEVELGYDSTRAVTLEMMAHHVRAVANGATRTHICGDLPADTYTTPAQAVESAQVLTEAGAHSVKLEGALVPQVEAIIAAGIPVMGHVGLLPQTAGCHARQMAGQVGRCTAAAAAAWRECRRPRRCPLLLPTAAAWRRARCGPLWG